MATGWQGSTRKATLPPNWPAIRRQVLERDGHRCTWPDPAAPDGRCLAAATDVDHVGDRDDHDPANLRSLCGPHHLQRTSGQANASRWRHTRRRPPERHPGLT